MRPRCASGFDGHPGADTSRTGSSACALATRDVPTRRLEPSRAQLPRPTPTRTGTRPGMRAAPTLERGPRPDLRFRPTAASLVGVPAMQARCARSWTPAPERGGRSPSATSWRWRPSASARDGDVDPDMLKTLAFALDRARAGECAADRSTFSDHTDPLRAETPGWSYATGPPASSEARARTSARSSMRQGQCVRGGGTRSSGSSTSTRRSSTPVSFSSRCIASVPRTTARL
jgi:hypothetical protein